MATCPDPSVLELLDELGVGAVATVHRAVDHGSGQHYAVKLLHERNARDPRAAQRFARETELARGLKDPHIVAVHGAVEIGGRQALVMELVEGPTLADLIAAEAPFAEHRLIRMARAIAQGLSVAHGGGVIHRDLKPANILIGRDDDGGELAKIADFGMARATSFAGLGRESMVVLGTPDYMAPESLDPLAVDPRSDLYALGCIMVEMMTGRPPFAGPTPLAVLEAHRNRAAPELPDDYSPALRELVGALLAKQPGDRPQTASVVVELLDGLAATSSELAERDALQLGPTLVDAAAAGRCARCGAAVIHGVRMCIDCGLARVIVEGGKWSVFVTGPGQVGDKLDAKRRAALLAWLRANPDAGLDVEDFAQRIPRVPFPLVTGVSEASAKALGESLAQLGLMATAQMGGRLSHELMNEKVFRIGARRGRIALPLMLFALPVMLALLVLTLPLLPVYFAAIAWWTSKPALGVGHGKGLALPPHTSAGLQQLEARVAFVGERHRPGLRAVVSRVMALIESTPTDARAGIDGEMAHAINVATVASERLTELDAIVGHADFDPSGAEHRRDLRERDMWSARMLELTATLDTLVSRAASARAQLGAAGTAQDRTMLEQLRLDIEALEDVQRGST